MDVINNNTISPQMIFNKIIYQTHPVLLINIAINKNTTKFASIIKRNILHLTFVRYKRREKIQYINIFFIAHVNHELFNIKYSSYCFGVSYKITENAILTLAKDEHILRSEFCT